MTIYRKGALEKPSQELVRGSISSKNQAAGCSQLSWLNISEIPGPKGHAWPKELIVKVPARGTDIQSHSILPPAGNVRGWAVESWKF